MSRMYNSLKVAVQETLQRGNANSLRIALVRGNHATGLTDEIDELESRVAARIGRLKAAVKEREAVVTGEAEYAKQIITSLSVNVASLETKLNEAEDTIRRKDSDRQKMEESLTAEIQNLQNEVKKKEQALAGREGEINDLKSKIDVPEKQVKQFEAVIAEAVNRARIAEQFAESSKAKIVALEAQLSEREEIVRGKDANIKGLVGQLHAKIQELESQVRNNEELLADREAQVKDFKFKLRVLKNWIKEMSPFFRQAEEALAAVDAQEIGTVLPGERLTRIEEKPAYLQPDDAGVACGATDAAQETVPRNFFDRMTVALTHVLGPRAYLIVRNHVTALGESTERFPQARIAELVEIVSQEIADENLRIGFREVLGEIQ